MKVVIFNFCYKGNKCSGIIESSLVGYSSISLVCIEGCVKNYRCMFGCYDLFGNNCYKFVNRILVVLCMRFSYCLLWCCGLCDDVFYSWK